MSSSIKLKYRLISFRISLVSRLMAVVNERCCKKDIKISENEIVSVILQRVLCNDQYSCSMKCAATFSCFSFFVGSIHDLEHIRLQSKNKVVRLFQEKKMISAWDSAVT